jgi:hypothetical protein
VDEGQSAEGKEKPFHFRCYKPSHGELKCTVKLLCDICGSTEHLTRKCLIPKQPRQLADPCGYDVSGLSVRILYPGYHRSLVIAQKSGYDRFLPTPNGWGTIHPVSDMTPPLLDKEEGPPT